MFEPLKFIMYHLPSTINEDTQQR